MTPAQQPSQLQICVFGGGLPGQRQEYLAAARELGSEIARRGMSLVYGGAHFGLMGALADAALAGGAKVIGVIPRSIADEVAHPGLTELILVDGLAARKDHMAELADAFVALPGGAGTVNELSEVWTTAKLALHHKPITVLSIAGYYSPFLAFVEYSVGEQLMLPQHRDLLAVATDPSTALDTIERHALGHGRREPDRWTPGPPAVRVGG